MRNELYKGEKSNFLKPVKKQGGGLANDVILRVSDLSISFRVAHGRLQAIRGVNFQLSAGRTLAIVGESGSGKSVTVKAIMGILSKNETIEKGEILFFPRDEKEPAVDLAKMKRKKVVEQFCGRKIAMIFQDPMTALNPTMTIGKQVMEGIIRHQKKSKQEAYQRAIALLDEVGITNPQKRMKSYPHQLSGGMRQRVVIAIALSCNPDILICDEPTTALDVTIQAKILELLQNIQRKNHLAILFITHNLGVVAKIADEVAVMYAGKIVEQGTAEEIFFDPRHPYTRGLLSSLPDLNTKEEYLYSIPGAPPNLLKEIRGEAFAYRNPYALNIDFEKEAPVYEISKTHRVASWLLHEKAPEIDLYPQLTIRIQKALHV